MGNAIISGSASGIGEATRKRLESLGDRVVGIDIRDAEIVTDLSTPEGRTQAIAQSLEMTGGEIDAVVLCAGLSGVNSRADTTLSVNYFGSVELFDGLRSAMEGRPNPCAIGLVSNSSQFGIDYDEPIVLELLAGNEERCREMVREMDRGAAYRFTKHALARAIRHRAVEWGPLGVRINAIVPGMTDTPMVRAIEEDPEMGPFAGMLPIPLGRKGTSEEMAGVIAFMLSDAAAYITGMMLWVDGGTDAAVRPDRF
ncbi:MAG: SDR family oxidoreductase [Deltaproteobacteria bacterium]|jgi:NAD(P)-dependent dehydrogenase (short-subunit alcohol dehydrogenase family)|nr:SDR family oxidoreductase [Deltaproteobacteria bacterium]MBW2498941.1 SDR family oxidoreductase [Deltaproteobacteria bacterium]